MTVLRSTRFSGNVDLTGVLNGGLGLAAGLNFLQGKITFDPTKFSLKSATNVTLLIRESSLFL